MSTLYFTATALIVTSMAGNEFAVAAFVHPQLYKLPPLEHARVVTRLAGILGKIMPLWYGLSLLLIAGAAYLYRPVFHGPGLLLMLAALLWAGVIVVTVTMLVPINNRIARLNAAEPYLGWLEDRARWDALHRVRVLVLLVAAALVLTVLLRNTPTL